MMTEPEKTPERAVVVQLRAGACNRMALEAAARFARAFGALFDALYIEDEAVFSLAELPFAREISLTGRRSRALSAAGLGREMRCQAQALRKDIEQTAHRVGVQWRYEVVRQAPAEALRRASERARILVLGEPMAGPERPRVATISACLDQVEACVIVGPQASRARGPVVIVLDELSALAPMARLAERWAPAPEDEIVILLAGAAGARVSLRARIAEAFAPGRPISVQPIDDVAPLTAIADIAGRSRAGLVLLRAGGRLGTDDASLRRLVGALECPLAILQPA